MKDAAVQSFFQDLSATYDETIVKGVPLYRSLLDALVRSLEPIDPEAPLHILDLGCGTGNLSTRIAQQLPNARFTLLDLSSEMLARSEAKLRATGHKVTALQASFMDADLPAGSVDRVVSSLALHHLMDSDKWALYPRVAQWLKPGGTFWCADMVLAVPAETAQPLALAYWRDLCRAQGATEDDIALWEQHGRDFDHMAPLHAHFSALQAAGFPEPDCRWRDGLWAVFGGQLPGTTQP